MSNSESPNSAPTVKEPAAATALTEAAKPAITVRNKRVYFDVETKMHTLKRIDNGEAKSAIIREMRLPPSTLATWIKDRERIAELYRHSVGRRKRLRRQTGDDATQMAGDDAKSGIGAETATMIEVDPANAPHHLGGPFVIPCCAATPAKVGAATFDGGGSASSSPAGSSGGPPDAAEDTEEAEAASADGEDDEDNSGERKSTPTPQPQPMPQHPAGTIAIPLVRRPPQVVLPRPLVPRGLQQLPPTQPQLQPMPSVTIGLRPPPHHAVSLGAFLTAGIAASQNQVAPPQLPQLHHQPPPPQPQQLEQPPGVTKADLEELLQRYVAQVSAILTFTISPLHNSLEQLARQLSEVKQHQQQQHETLRSRQAEARARWDWLEHTRPHPTEPEKLVLASDTNYEASVPAAWIRECCDLEPDRTLANLVRRAFNRDRLLALPAGALAEDRTFRALRHYVTFTQGPVSRDFSARGVQHLLELS